MKLRPTNSSLAGGSQCWTASRATSYMSCLLGFSKDVLQATATEHGVIMTIYFYYYTYIYIYVLIGVGKVSLKVATRGGSSCYNIFMDPCFACSHLQGQDPKFPKQDTRPGHSDSCPVVKVCPCCCEGQNISKWVQISHEPSCSTSEWPLCEECTIAELQKYVQGS